jgi:hypothetical protein
MTERPPDHDIPETDEVQDVEEGDIPTTDSPEGTPFGEDPEADGLFLGDSLSE